MMRDWGDGRVYRRGTSWWLQYSVEGRRFREAARVYDPKLRRKRPVRNEAEAEKVLKMRLREAGRDDFASPPARRIRVNALLDQLLRHLRNQGKRSVPKVESHLKSVRNYFGDRRAAAVTSDDIERYKEARLKDGRKPATINRELEALRQAYLHAVEKKRLPVGRAPHIDLFSVDNTRTGFFTVAEVNDLLRHIPDPDLGDFIEWGFRTGMRKGEASALTWDMLDSSDEPWVLRAPGSITKNRRGRSIGLDGAVRVIIERRLEARRLDCPLIFHRVSKGRGGQPVRAFDKMWRNALKDAGLPHGRLFHDLRRSAVRNLIRAGVDESTAMKVSGHRTRSMLDRYNIIEETETAAALARVDAWLSTQPEGRNVKRAQFGHTRAAGSGNSLIYQGVMAEAGGNRTQTEQHTGGQPVDSDPEDSESEPVLASLNPPRSSYRTGSSA